MSVFSDHVQAAAVAFTEKAFELNVSTVNRSLTSTGTSNAVSVTESGIVYAIGMYITSSPADTPTAVIEFDTDGEGTKSVQLYTSSNGCKIGSVRAWCPSIGSSAGTWDLGGAGQSLMIQLGIRYLTSMRVGINCTDDGTQGAVQLTVYRGTEK
jgi:hypothetical protein